MDLKLASLPLTYAVVLFATSPASAFQHSSAEKAQQEFEKLQAVSKTIPAPEYVGRNPDAEIESLGKLADLRGHIQRTRIEFESEIKVGNQPFRNLRLTCDLILRDLQEFEAAAKKHASLPAIQDDLDHVVKMAKQSIEFQAPAYFRSGNDIDRRTQAVKQRIRYLTAIAPESNELKTAIRLSDETAKQVREIQKGLEKGILEQNELPPDQYTQSDRDAIHKLLKDKWHKEGGKSKLLKVGVVGTDWTRRVSWEIQNRTLYKVDQSLIQGYVLVAWNNQTAVRHSINLIKDHLSSDQISTYFLSDPKAEPELVDQILISKLK